MKKAFVTRYKGNPILTKDDIPYPVQTVHNAGVTKFNGRYIMLFRSHLDTGRSIIGVAESENGFKFKPRPKPFMVPAQEPPFCEYEEYGVENPPYYKHRRFILHKLQCIFGKWRPHRIG